MGLWWWFDPERLSAVVHERLIDSISKVQVTASGQITMADVRARPHGMDRFGPRGWVDNVGRKEHQQKQQACLAEECSAQILTLGLVEGQFTTRPEVTLTIRACHHRLVILIESFGGSLGLFFRLVSCAQGLTSLGVCNSVMTTHELGCLFSLPFGKGWGGGKTQHQRCRNSSECLHSGYSVWSVSEGIEKKS